MEILLLFLDEKTSLKPLKLGVLGKVAVKWLAGKKRSKFSLDFVAYFWEKNFKNLKIHDVKGSFLVSLRY